MKISHKLFLTLIGYTTVVLVVTLLLARWSFQQGFLEFTKGLEKQRIERLASVLETLYAKNSNSWGFIDGRAFDEYLSNSLPPHRPRGPRGPEGRRPPPRAFPENESFRPPDSLNTPLTGLFATNGTYISGENSLAKKDAVMRHDLKVNGIIVGELLSWPPKTHSDNLATTFMQQQLHTSLIIGFTCLCIAAFLAWGLTKQLLKPIRSLHNSIVTLASGVFQLPKSAPRKDELGDLMQNVQHLADTLDKTREAKNKWFASISHELRTPLTVLVGEIEVLQAGIRPFNAKSLGSLEQEISMLERLVEDLYQLSLSDIGGLKYTFESIIINDIVRAACDSLANKFDAKGLCVNLLIDEEFECNGDYTRMSQLVINLIHNSVLYTDAPGEVWVSLSKVNNSILFVVEDSAPGVALADCEVLFEPLFRSDQARSRRGNGAGLGLAICKNIVEAHRGEIVALPSAKGGVKIMVTLPIDMDKI